MLSKEQVATLNAFTDGPIILTEALLEEILGRIQNYIERNEIEDECSSE